MLSNRFTKPAAANNGNNQRDILNELNLVIIESKNGKSIPPMGMAIFIIPSTVPAKSLYIRPASVLMSGSSADRVMPVKYIKT
jgi:hypothetical protein